MNPTHTHMEKLYHKIFIFIIIVCREQHWVKQGKAMYNMEGSWVHWEALAGVWIICDIIQCFKLQIQTINN